MTARFIPALLLVFAAAASPLRGEGTIWVSPSGNDANPGTEDRPLKTLEGARDLVRTMNADMKDDITVFVTGDYHLKNPVRFGPKDSATNGYSIIYTAAPGAHPSVDGGSEIGGWVPATANSGSWTSPGHGPSITVLANLGILAFVNGNMATLEFPASTLGGYSYRPRKGEDLTKSRVVLAASDGLVSIEGSEESPVRGLVFKGIDFQYCRGDAAITIVKAADIQFLEDRLLYIGGSAIKISRADSVIVDSALIGSVGENGIQADAASNLRVSQTRFAGIGGLKAPGDGSVIDLRSCAAQIDHCLFEDYPNEPIRAADSSVSRDANIERPPVVPFRGEPAMETARDGAGPAPYNLSLEDERVSAVTPPEPPSAVRAFATGRSAVVTWVPSSLSGGKPYDRFTLTASTGGVVAVPAADFFRTGYATVPNLEAGQPVTFTVTASTAAGESAPSLASPPVTPSRRFRPLPNGQAQVSVERHGDRITVHISPPVDPKFPIVAYNVSVGSGPVVRVQGLDLWANGEMGPVIRTFPVPVVTDGTVNGITVFAVGAGAERLPAIGAFVKVPAAQTPNPGR